MRSLARDPGEARHAVTLLLELSKEESLRERISKVQGCILLLVTITNSENTPAAANAKELLKLLANTNDNVILMANANYFKPLVQSLGEGNPKFPIFSLFIVYLKSFCCLEGIMVLAQIDPPNYSYLVAVVI